MELLYNNTYYKFADALLEEDTTAKVDTSKITTMFKEYIDSSTKTDTLLQTFTNSLAKSLNVSTSTNKDEEAKEDNQSKIDPDQIAKSIELISSITKSLSNIKL